jgi:amidase
MSEYAFKSAVALASAIAAKEVSSLELTDMYIDRVESLDPDINAVVVKDFERGREDARAADSAVAAGKALGPLHGVPMTIKEAYDIRGLPTTWGLPEFEHNIATTDSEMVVRMKRAGAHFFRQNQCPPKSCRFSKF